MGSTGLRLNSNADHMTIQSHNVKGDALDPPVWKEVRNIVTSTIFNQVKYI
jgi:hypothetical protein